MLVMEYLIQVKYCLHNGVICLWAYPNPNTVTSFFV